MGGDGLSEAQAGMAAALRLTPRQRVCLAAIDKAGLEKCRSGYRLAFTLRSASFNTATVQSLLRAGFAEKRDFGRIGITEAGRAVLAIPFETRAAKPENAPSPYYQRQRAAHRARYQSTTRPRLPYVDN